MMKTAVKSILTFSHYSHERFNVRSNKDQRKFIDRYTVAYTDERGDVYMKAFEALKGEKPNVPLSGTHAELFAAQFQF